jgi:carboxymethylenebutenolidase
VGNVNVDNSDMPLHVSIPETQRTVPGIVVVHGKSGLEEFIKDTTRVFAQLGYAAVAPNLYHRDGPDCKDDSDTRKSRLRDPSLIRDIEGAVGFLKNHKQVDSGKLGIVGFCMGGRLVYLTSAAIKDLKAAVMFLRWRHDDTIRRRPSPFERTSEITCPIQGHFGATTIRVQSPSFNSYAGAAHAFVNTGSDNYRPHAAAQSWPKAMEFF